MIDSVGVKVGKGGMVKHAGRTFWSAEAANRAGQWVKLMLPRRADKRLTLIDSAGKRFGVSLVLDPFEFDIEAARRILGRGREARASVVRRHITELLDIFDQRFERRLKRSEPLDAPFGHHRVGHVRRALHRAGSFLIELSQSGGEKSPHGIDPDIEKIEAVFDPRKELIELCGQEASPKVEREPRPAAEGGHCLSGDAK